METSAYLTPKQKLFCDEYLTDYNATRAALRAGYSASTALNGQLMGMPKIKLHLQQRMAASAEKAQVTHDMVLRELSKIAFGTMGNYFMPDGSLKPMNHLSEDEKSAIHSISVREDATGTGSTTRIRLNNKLSALEKIARHLKFYDMEVRKPEPVYVYLDKDEMTEDDSFDDEEEWEEEEGCELRVAGCGEDSGELRVASCGEDSGELRVAGCGEDSGELGVASGELCVGEESGEAVNSDGGVVDDIFKAFMAKKAAYRPVRLSSTFVLVKTDSQLYAEAEAEVAKLAFR